MRYFEVPATQLSNKIGRMGEARSVSTQNLWGCPNNLLDGIWTFDRIRTPAG
jgi:hypothetical protein